MHYISTRQKTKDSLSFKDVLLSGLAHDGGLFVPLSYPKFTKGEMLEMAKMPYVDLAFAVTKPFIGDDIDDASYKEILQKAYQNFSHPDVTPLRHHENNIHVLELFHGPTIAFKDVALQLLGELFEHFLTKENSHTTIIGATSGDTGSAAMQAFKGRKNIDVFILFPHQKTSDIQRKQMTTIGADNIHALSLKGNFDDCQDMVKNLFADENLRKQLNFSAVNSINWGRIMAQIVYYAYASLRLSNMGGDSDAPYIDVCVPTGNFGNILAAWVAKKMGFPLRHLIIASNENDILTRFIKNNDMRIHSVKETLSPSMDIQISSNFERFLFEAMGRDGDKCAQTINDFRKSGQMAVSDEIWARARENFQAFSVSDDETLAEMQILFKKTGLFYDPHTAIAMRTARQFKEKTDDNIPIIVAATAHAAKFSDAVQQSCKKAPPLPPHLSHLHDSEEKYIVIENSINDIRDYLLKFSNAR